MLCFQTAIFIGTVLQQKIENNNFFTLKVAAYPKNLDLLHFG